MKKFLKSRLFSFIILIIATVITVTLGAVSYARFEMNYHDEIIAEYTDFCLSHDGDGKSTILSRQGDEYVGFMSISVNNAVETGSGLEISKRQIAFDMRTPNASELAGGYIFDVWGQPISVVSSDSHKYEVDIVDIYGNSLVDDVILGEEHEHTPVFVSKNINLEIKRKAGYETLDAIEYITIIIATSLPYKNTLAFNISVSSRKIMFSSDSKDYFGFEDISVNIITSSYYEFGNDEDDISDKPVKVTLTYTDGSLMFDYERFRLSVEGNLSVGDAVFSNQFSYSDGVIVLYLAPGSDVDLHFYVQGSTFEISSEVIFDMNEDNVADYDYTDQCAGLTAGVVVSR